MRGFYGNRLDRSFIPLVLRLTHVCRRWRHCACSTARLWCDMAIIHHRRSSLNKTSEARVRQELESLSSLAELFLARSGTLPMNVSFDLDYKPFEEIQGCFQTWRSCIARCKSLRLHVVVPMLRLFFPVPVELPLLESLQYIPVFCSPVIPVSLANISVPRLASLSLDSIRETDSIDIGIPASQLTELRLENLNLSVIRLLEAQCQSLKTVRLHFDRSVVSRMRPMTFPNLEDAIRSWNRRCRFRSSSRNNSLQSSTIRARSVRQSCSQAKKRRRPLSSVRRHCASRRL